MHSVERELTLEESKRYQAPNNVVLIRARRGESVFAVRREVVVGGQDFANAELASDSRTNEPVVSFRLDVSGARRFGRFTMENVGKTVAVDGEVFSAPVFREASHLGGSGQITGNGDDIAALAIHLRSGALPAAFSVVEERLIGDRGK